jgi:membrane-associated HD superfamily phosphohydrolase
VNDTDDKTRLISLSLKLLNYMGLAQIICVNLAQKGRLKAQKVGPSWVTTPQDVEDYIASRQKRGSLRDDIQPQIDKYHLSEL